MPIVKKFYEPKEIDLSFIEYKKQIERQEHICTSIRPYQTLGYLTPDEYYQEYIKKGGAVSLM